MMMMTFGCVQTEQPQSLLGLTTNHSLEKPQRDAGNTVSVKCSRTGVRSKRHLHRRTDGSAH